MNLDDGYMGSGKRLKNAIKCYGAENFITEILHIFDEEWKMNLAERILVVPDPEISYNLCPGGQGGFGFINDRGMNVGRFYAHSEEASSKRSRTMKNIWNDPTSDERRSTLSLKLKQNPLTGGGVKFHTEETKIRMRKSKNVGETNSQFGTCWITNDKENKKIPKDSIDDWLIKGYRKGRLCIRMPPDS